MIRSIGVDIGSSRIKIAYLEIQAKSFVVKGLYEIPRKNNVDPGEQIAEFIKKEALKIDRIAVGLGNSPIFIKKMQFPFNDRSRVQMATESDFADVLPFDIEDHIVEYKSLGKSNKQHNFLAGICSSEAVGLINRYFEKSALVPHCCFVDIEALAQLSLAQNISKEIGSDKPYAIVDFGYHSLKIAILQGNNNTVFSKDSDSKSEFDLMDLRTLNRGSSEVIEWVADENKMSFEKAYRWLHKEAEILDSSKARERDRDENDKLSDSIKTAFRPLFVEIYQTLQAFRGRTHIFPEHIYFTGGMTQIKGFEEFFSKEIRVSSSQWPIFTGFNTQSIKPKEKQQRAFALALSLAHYFGIKKPRGWLNFRRNTQSDRKIISSLVQKAKSPTTRPYFITFALTAIFLVLYGWLTKHFVNKQIAEEQIALQAELRQLNPKLGSSVKRMAKDLKKASVTFEAEKKALDRKMAQQVPSKRLRARSDVLLDLSKAPFAAEQVLSNLKLGPKSIEAQISTTKTLDDKDKKLWQDYLTEKGYLEAKITQSTANGPSTLNAKIPEE